ncbi:MAG: cation-transporting P-type ATPase [Actinobacteria bacterium]|nr:cation-transporting P-type ATPase [Actinomycetota bacterium]
MPEFYTLNTEELYKELDVSPNGLSEEEAKKRLEIYGPNLIKKKRKRSLILRFLDNFVHVLAIILWIAAALCFIPRVNMPQLGYAIILVVVINAVFSFLQEFRAEKALEALNKILPSYARVLRSGEIKETLSGELVPGDILILNEGDNVSADARLIESYDLRTNNSVLTGESDPQRKSTVAIVNREVDTLRLTNVVYAGTSISSGTGKAIVYSTGMKTEFGKIANITQSVKEELSPLQKEINKASQMLVYIAVGVGVLFFILSLFVIKLGFLASFVFAIGIIVAFVPEGMLPTVTLALAMGVQRMAKRNALIKKLSSVETLGSTTVICTDKTGTLTQNEMTVREIWINGSSYDISGVGYNPAGDFNLEGKKIASNEKEIAFKKISRAMSYCNNSRLYKDKNTEQWVIKGDPTEGALLVAARKADFDYESEMEKDPRIFLLPFDSTRKRMSSIHETSDGIFAFVKGAPKEMLSLCSKIEINGRIEDLDQQKLQEIMKSNDIYAKRALRVLAIAYRNLTDLKEEYSIENVEKDLVFLGLAAMIDPPRPEVEAAVKECFKAGIKIIMITGDYGLTADAIARKIGIIKGESRIILGTDLEKMSEEELGKVVKLDNIIFARVSPEHKMKIAQALKNNGHTVAMTGDGVNDAPALKTADIGIAMGISGTDVAREAADMILTDDNFASIVNAIEEGRAVFENLRKFINYILTSNIPEAVPFIMMVIFKIPLPLTVMQILAIDLGTDLLPSLALAAEPPEPGIMNKLPRPKNERLLTGKNLIKAYLFLGPVEAAVAMIAFLIVYYDNGITFAKLRQIGANPVNYVNDRVYQTATTANHAAIIMSQIGNAFAWRSNYESVFKIGFFKNKLLFWGILGEIIIINALIYIPRLNSVFNHHPLSWNYWFILIAFIPSVLIVEELRKLIVRYFNYKFRKPVINKAV